MNSLLEHLELDDTLDVFACHGVAGIVGSILTGFFATETVNPDGANGVFYGSWELMVPQLTGTLAAIVFAGLGTAFILKVIQLTIGIRVSEGAETWLDQAEHDEQAYVNHDGWPLGQLLVAKGVVAASDLAICLEEQRRSEVPKRLGTIVVERGLVELGVIEKLIEQQRVAA